MDEHLKRQHIASLTLYAEELAQDPDNSLSDALLRPLLTEAEYAQYKAVRKAYAASWVEMPTLPREAAEFWERCEKAIKASNRAKTPKAKKAASSMAEKAAELFCDVPEEQRSYFVELSHEEWHMEFPNVEELLPIPVNLRRTRPFPGTPKNAAQRQAVDAALERLTRDAEADAAAVISVKDRLAGLLRRSDD